MVEKQNHFILEVAKWIVAFFAIVGPVLWIIFLFNPPVWLLEPNVQIRILAILAYVLLVMFIYIKTILWRKAK